MSDMLFFDLHCDTISKLCLQGGGLGRNGLHIDLDKLSRGGCLAQCFAAFIMTHGEAEECGAERDPWLWFVRLADAFYREMEAARSRIAPVRRAADIEENRRAGRLSALLTVEDGVLLEGQLRRLDALHDRGVAMLSLTWNYENSLGYPNSADPELHGLGLKAFGREAVERMEELGMIVDVSHLSEGGFWDVAEQAKRPFVASHSCARALCDHSRNLTDSQLRAIGEHGGVCGVNFFSEFLTGGGYTRAEDIVRHMEHMVRVSGIESVAVGSDFDGIDCELELGDYGGMPLLLDEMSRKFTDDEIEKICNLNALRVFRDVAG